MKFPRNVGYIYKNKTLIKFPPRKPQIFPPPQKKKKIRGSLLVESTELEPTTPDYERKYSSRLNGMAAVVLPHDN
jgi:hypothetical protein